MMVLAAAVGAIVLGIVASTKEEKPRVGARRTVRVGRARSEPGIDCGHFPWLADEVDEAMSALVEMKPDATVRELVLHALERVYPTTPEGEPARWPSKPEDCARMHAIEARVWVRALVHRSYAQDRIAEEAWYESGGR